MWRRLLRGLQPDRDLDDEIEAHLDLRASHHRNQGLSAEEAAARARHQFGDIVAIKEEMRKTRSVSPRILMASALAATAVVVWLLQLRLAELPELPPAPILRNVDLSSGEPPPPPPPPPTWDEYVRQAQGFKGLKDENQKTR